MVRKYKDSTPQVSPPLLCSILPMQILTIVPFIISVKQFRYLIQSLTYNREKTTKRRYFNILREIIISFRDLMKYLISTFRCDIYTLSSSTAANSSYDAVEQIGAVCTLSSSIRNEFFRWYSRRDQ
ncbi:hypothetical protein TNCV_2067191 [Trichonephila clavipes]|uniref:Uncharacterized protein n=1 Tax=Trichonephila clavipes TaxID=2585209 RepID=A0A8X6W2I0_TRICX|nr:hypothetical protein TNCV_2067191 [Trichonephila clavipes]